jgi:DNA-directed RNA polymerase specialized sigma24 family protein
LQDVLQELVEAYRLPEPIEQVGAWLFRVARNRIIDRFRKKRDRPALEAIEDSAEAAGEYRLDLALPALDAGPEAAFARTVNQHIAGPETLRGFASAPALAAGVRRIGPLKENIDEVQS